MDQVWVKPALRLVAGAAVLLVAVIAIFFVFPFLKMSGAFHKVVPMPLGNCTALTGVIGANDVQIDHEKNLMFVSATDRSAPGGPSPQDGLYVMDLGDKSAGFKKLAGAPADFHPHGLSLYIAGNGARTLAVINHENSNDLAGTVDLFDVTDGPDGVRLHQTAHVSGSLLSAPTDIVAVGPQRFYVLNEFGHSSGFLNWLAFYGRLPDGDVVFYDAGRMSIASRGLQSPAGISAAPDYQFIYISEMLARRLDTFVGDPFTGELTKRNELAIPTMLDNIDVDSDGFVWVAGHPKGLPRSAHALSPSEIWKVQILHGIPISARRFYANLGDQISAASVGAKQGEHIYIGSVTDTKVLDCTLPPGTT